MLQKEIKTQKITWFKLDNAAKIFPGQSTDTWSNIFRFSVQLREKVDPDLLSVALKRVLPRFPCFDVCIKKGFFWYYFEKNPNGAPDVSPDISNPCHRVKFNENKGYLFRVYYFDKRISVDFFHSLTDGRGSSYFVCTLAAEYLRLKGYDIPCGEAVLDIFEEASEEELEDSFLRNAGSKGKVERSGKRVYHYKGTRMPDHTVNITSGIMSLSQLKNLAKSKNATVTELIESLLLYTMYLKQKSENIRQKEVSVQIPVDLRNVFHSHTLRNYSLTYIARLDPNLGDYTFDEVLSHVKTYLHHIHNEKYLRAMTTSNLKLENSVLKYFPLFLKDLGIGIAFMITGEQTTSVLGSNLGLVKLPKEMQEHVERMYFMAGPGVLNGARCGAVGYNDTFTLTFANIYKESDIEREFFTRLVKMGLHVKIESNRR